MPSSGERMPHTEAAFQRLSAGDTIPTVRAFLRTFYPLITDGARNLTIKRASKRMALAVAAAPVAAAVPIVAKALGAVPVAAKAAGGVGPLPVGAAIPQIAALPLAVPQAAPKAAAAVPFNAFGPVVKAAPPPPRHVVPPQVVPALLPVALPRAEGRRAEEEQDRWGMQWAEELNQEQRRTLKRRQRVAEDFSRRVNSRHSFRC